MKFYLEYEVDDNGDIIINIPATRRVKFVIGDILNENIVMLDIDAIVHAKNFQLDGTIDDSGSSPSPPPTTDEPTTTTDEPTTTTDEPTTTTDEPTTTPTEENPD
jgi:hypothetical protein